MSKRRRSNNIRPITDGSRRRLAQSANRQLSDYRRHSASYLISTVPDDTRRSPKPSSFVRHSPIIQSRASHRVSRSINLLGQVISGVQLPKRAITCAKRSIRREVLFATRQTGKGAKARFRRRDGDSKEKCK